jgi:hypothetical protein
MTLQLLNQSVHDMTYLITNNCDIWSYIDQWLYTWHSLASWIFMHFYTFPFPSFVSPPTKKWVMEQLCNQCINLWGCIQKFLDWPPGVRTANGTAPCQ